MKKGHILYCIAIMLFGSGIFGIKTLTAQTIFNPKAGIHAAAIDGNFKDSSVINSRLGWQIGLDIRKGSGLFFFNPGILYRVTSADVKKDVDLGGSLSQLNSTTTIQSISVPINGGVYLTGKESALLRIYLHGGVTPSYIIGMKSPEKFDLDPSEFNRFQFGINGGIGVDLLFLNISATYEYYLQDYFKNRPGKNTMISFNIGFVF